MFLLLTDEQGEVQKLSPTCPRSHSQEVIEQRSNPGSLMPECCGNCSSAQCCWKEAEGRALTSLCVSRERVDKDGQVGFPGGGGCLKWY